MAKKTNATTVNAPIKEQTYPYELLRDNCFEIFGYNKEVLDGAMYDKDKTKEYTKRYCEECIVKFLNKKQK